MFKKKGLISEERGNSEDDSISVLRVPSSKPPRLLSESQEAVGESEKIISLQSQVKLEG